MTLTLAASRYGPAQVRLLRLLRQPDRHDVKEMTLEVQLEGDFEAAHTRGDNRNLLPADTVKNTIYALAKLYPTEQLEEFGLRLIEHLLDSHAAVARVTVVAVEHPWTRLVLGGQPHRCAFRNAGSERRTARLAGTRRQTTVEAGIEGLGVLKTADSAFEGFVHDPFTTQPESGDCILWTVLEARWQYTGAETAFGPAWHGVRKVLLETFAEHSSRSLQHTLYSMGEAVLSNYDDIAEIQLRLPQQPCLPVDLAPFGLQNANEVFLPSEEPHGVIEATLRKG